MLSLWRGTCHSYIFQNSDVALISNVTPASVARFVVHWPAELKAAGLIPDLGHPGMLGVWALLIRSVLCERR